MRLLFVTCRYPWPPRRGDQVRALEQLPLLAERHRVTALVPTPPPGAPAPPPDLPFELAFYRPASRLDQAAGVASALARGRPLQTGLFESPDLARQLLARRREVDAVWLQLVRLAPWLDQLAGLPVFVDLIDALSLNLERRAALDRAWLRPILRFEAGRLRRAEAQLLARVAGAAVVCERDRRHLLAGQPATVAERLAVVPLVREPKAPASAPPVAGEAPTLALTGNLGYFPNREGAAWFLDQVWPGLAARVPAARLMLAGDRPPRALVRQAQRAGATLLAAPADLAPILAAATVALAPLRAGSGVPIKILEAWALGVPVVASAHAAAGTTGRAGEDLRVADTPAAWVDNLVDLLTDPAARARLATAGRARLRADYAPARVVAALARLLP